MLYNLIMTLEKFMEELNLNHVRPNTLRNYTFVLNNLNRYKELDTYTADDLKAYITKYKEDFLKRKGKKPKDGGLNAIYAVCKRYFLWSNKPDVVSWIKTKNGFKKINPNKLLTPAEVQNMLRLSSSDRNKCLLAMVYESGARISEMLALLVEDVKISNGEAKIRIPDNRECEDNSCKTGSRSIVLIESVPYIEKWISVMKKSDKLFDFGYSGSEQMLQKMASDAGITKKVYWHLLRHTRATEMARLGMQETAMKKRFGWTEDSAMIKRYISLTDEDADNSYREALGLGVKKKDMAINPIARRCAKCGKLVETGEYCQQCSEIQILSESNTKTMFENQQLKADYNELKKQVEFITAALQAKR